MRLGEIYNNSAKPVISFEVFPPKGSGSEYEEKLKNLFIEIEKLLKFNPSFISVTYGAGGSTRDKTLDLVVKIKNKFNVEPIAHFTCVSFDKEQMLNYVKLIEKNGIKNILALRGDAPDGMEHFIPPENGFSHANELVKFIKDNTDLSVAVAGYPEKHPEAKDLKTDVTFLKNKVEAGADVIYTQLFFDNNDYFKFVDLARENGVTAPIIPGIMVIQTISQIERIIKLSGSKIPENLYSKIKKYENEPETIRKIGIEYSINQVRELKKYGVKGFHFYPLNKAYAVSEVLNNI